jgi:cytochrome bd-type quinol oxidase subunit 1
MQTPAGYVVRDGRFEPANWVQVIFNPSFHWRWPHMVVAVLISSSFLVAGLGAWDLVKGRALPWPPPGGAARCARPTWPPSSANSSRTNTWPTPETPRCC